MGQWHGSKRIEEEIVQGEQQASWDMVEGATGRGLGLRT
jgi:hypothetical protein